MATSLTNAALVPVAPLFPAQAGEPEGPQRVPVGREPGDLIKQQRSTQTI